MPYQKAGHPILNVGNGDLRNHRGTEGRLTESASNAESRVRQESPILPLGKDRTGEEKGEGRCEIREVKKWVKSKVGEGWVLTRLTEIEI